jgi:DNA-binding IclR family transcriptional regulator
MSRKKTPLDGSSTKNPLYVQSLEKGFAVLHAVAQSPQPSSLTEIIERTGLEKSAAQRFTHSLVALGYLKKDEGTRRYSLAIRLLDFTFSYLRSSALVAAAMPHLADASELCRETINLIIPDGLDIIYAVRIPVRRTVLLATLVGRRRPLHFTSGGRAIMSRLSDGEINAILDVIPKRGITAKTITDRQSNFDLIMEARRVGYSIAAEEALIGEIGVSAPIVTETGRPLAAVHSSVSTATWTVERVRDELAPIVQQAARLISAPLANAQESWGTTEPFGIRKY